MEDNFLIKLSFPCDSDTGEMCAMKEVTLFSDDPKSKESAKQLQQVICLPSSSPQTLSPRDKTKKEVCLNKPQNRYYFCLLNVWAITY